MSALVNLLLLLSALLSALTGVGGGVRQPQVAQAVAQAAVQAPAAVADRVRTARPVQTVATLVALCAAPVARVLAIPATQPIFAMRRRE